MTLVRRHIVSILQMVRERAFKNYVRLFGDIPMSEEEVKGYVSEDALTQNENNCLLRGRENNVPIIRKLLAEIRSDLASNKKVIIWQQLLKEIQKLPNQIHPRVIGYGHFPKEINKNMPQDFTKKLEFSNFCRKSSVLRMDYLSNFTGHKSYYLIDLLAELEQAIVECSVRNLELHGFKLISVPDILPVEIIKGCGMQTDAERTQVYTLDSGMCLSGTSEMALAGFYKGEILEEADLPVKVAAVSRCYRAETSGLKEEKGIYRVHNFTKVEMFSVCSAEHSGAILEDFKQIQYDFFNKLGLQFRLLDMPPKELGAPAYQKYDIEAWFPGKTIWGEISSCSNCTDYQAKRLHIKYRSRDGTLRYAHTVNGTAAATPRLLMALIESLQDDKGCIVLPECLSQLMKKIELRYKTKAAESKLFKYGKFIRKKIS